MEKAFSENFTSLRQINMVVFIMAAGFSLFPTVFENNLFKTGVYWLTAMIALSLCFFTKYKYNQEKVFARRKDEKRQSLSKRYIYLLISLSYANIMLFGVYVGVWSSTDKLAVIFMCFLVVGLLLFIIPPRFHLYLSSCALIIFIVSAILLKESYNWIFDVMNAMIAYLMSLIFNWRTNKYRLSAILSSSELEEERNVYLRQSNVDELTQLNNRRCFNQTFQRMRRFTKQKIVGETVPLSETI